MTVSAEQYLLARKSVTAIFFAMGVGVMAAATRFAEIKTQTGASDALFGYALAFGTIGSLLGNSASSHLTSRFGTRKVILLGASGMPISQGLLGSATSVWMLGLLVLSSAFFYSNTNIAMNAQGVDIEVHENRAIMPSLHAAWSFGSLTSSILGNIAANFLSPAVHLLINAALSVSITWSLGRNLLRVDPRAQQHAERKPISRAGHRRLFSLALAMTFGILAEISSNDWSAIHLHETLGVPLGQNGLGVTAFLIAQLTARSLGNRLTNRFGAYNIVRAGGLIGGGIYLTAILTTPHLDSRYQLPVMLLGIAALGLGVAPWPAAQMSAAGRLAEASTAHAMSVFAFYAAGLFLILRPTISTLMEFIGTTNTLAITAGLLMLSVRINRVLKPTQPL